MPLPPLQSKESAPVGYPMDWYRNMKRISPNLELKWALERGQRQAHWVIVEQLSGQPTRALWAVLTDDNRFRELCGRDLAAIAEMDTHANPHVYEEFMRRFAADEQEQEEALDKALDNRVDDLWSEHRRALDILDNKLRRCMAP